MMTLIGSAGSTLTPDRSWFLTYAAMAAALVGTLANASQNAWYPSIRSEKSVRPPNGCAGLHVTLTPRTKSAAVAARGGVGFPCPPCLIVMGEGRPAAPTFRLHGG